MSWLSNWINPKPIKPDTSGVDRLTEEYKAGTDKANAANEARYQQALKVRYNLRDYVRNLYQGAGDTALSDAEAQSNRTRAGRHQSLLDRGLYNTTVLDSENRAEDASLARTKGAIREGVAGQKAQSDMYLTGSIADTMERKQDVGPNAGLFQWSVTNEANRAAAEAAAKAKRRATYNKLFFQSEDASQGQDNAYNFLGSFLGGL